MPTDDSFAPTVDVRASMQHGARRPKKYEKAKDPRRALSRLMGYLSPYKGPLSLVLGCVAFSSLLGLAGPYLLGRAIDGSIGAKDLSSLGRTALLMRATARISLAVSIASTFICRFLPFFPREWTRAPGRRPS